MAIGVKQDEKQIRGKFATLRGKVYTFFEDNRKWRKRCMQLQQTGLLTLAQM